MDKRFDFERWQPPVLTEEMLRREEKRRHRKKLLITLYISFFVYLAGFGIVIKYVGNYSQTAAILCVLGLCLVTVISITTIICVLCKRRDLIYE